MRQRNGPAEKKERGGERSGEKSVGATPGAKARPGEAAEAEGGRCEATSGSVSDPARSGRGRRVRRARPGPGAGGNVCGVRCSRG